ncbi:hypothetical protein SAMN05216374_1000 [Tardiphaga sp. OK246]|nr:hypothetical protein SAMN05216374_1000 [Tardiphaga sp. OK246]
MMLVQVWVNGRIAANKYEFNEWRTPLYDVRVPILTPYFRFLNVGFEVDDDHAVSAFPKGTVVISTILRNQDLIRPKPGDFVTMSRTQSDRASEQPTVEITIRRIADSPLGDLWIVPINGDSGIPEVHLGPADHIDFNALPPLKRPLGIITGSIQNHSRL